MRGLVLNLPYRTITESQSLLEPKWRLPNPKSVTNKMGVGLGEVRVCRASMPFGFEASSFALPSEVCAECSIIGPF